MEDDAAPRAERTVALWNPPLLDAELGLRGERARRGFAAARRARRHAACGRSASPRAASRPSSSTASPPTGSTRQTAARLAPYRAGYTPQQRREIERRLVEGELLGVTSTDALELGIDIGDLDCAISVGFPGTVASLRQQWGRAGRRGHGLAVLVASEDALDQYFMREPETLLARQVEAAILDHANPRVLDGHVAAAAFEAPVDEADAATLGEEALAAGAARPRAAPHAARLGLGRARTRPRPALRSAPPRRTRSSSSTPRAATCSGSPSASAPTPPSTRARSTSTSAASTSCASSTSRRGARSSSRSTATGTRRRRRRRRPPIEEPLRVERRLGLELSFGRVSVTEQVVAYQKKAVADGSTLGHDPARAAADDVRHGGGLVRAPARTSSRGSRRCRSSSPRSTRPSTR